jgi:replicative DNA helicase
LDEKGKPIDVITIVEELGIQNIKLLGGVSYITQLAGSVPTTANFHFYEKLVRDYAQKRKAIQIAGKIIEQAKETEISKTLSDGIHDLMAVEEDQVHRSRNTTCLSSTEKNKSRIVANKHHYGFSIIGTPFLL